MRRRRRRNKRLAFLFGVVCYSGYLGGTDDGCGSVHYPGLLVAAGKFDAVAMQLDFMMVAWYRGFDDSGKTIAFNTGRRRLYWRGGQPT